MGDLFDQVHPRLDSEYARGVRGTFKPSGRFSLVPEEEQKKRKHNRYLERQRCLSVEAKRAIKDRSRILRNEKRRMIDLYKLGKGCELCGYKKCASALDFHHCFGPKEFSISSFISGNGSLVRIFAEIQKCKLLCRNCHMETHLLEDGHAPGKHTA